MRHILFVLICSITFNTAFSQIRIDLSADFGKNEYIQTDINPSVHHILCLGSRFSPNVSVDIAYKICNILNDDNRDGLLFYVGSGIGYSYLPTDKGYNSYPEMNTNGEWEIIEGDSWVEALSTINIPLKFEINYNKLVGFYIGWAHDFIAHKSDFFKENYKNTIKAETKGFNSFMIGLNAAIFKKAIVGVGLKRSNGEVMRYYSHGTQDFSLSQRQIFFKIGYRLKG